MKQAGFYSPYFDTLGGGELYSLRIIEWLLKNRYQVDLFWPDTGIRRDFEQRFGFTADKNLKLVGSLVNNPRQRWQQLRHYDYFFYLTDGSLFFSSAKKNILLVQSPVHMPAASFINQFKAATWHQFICNSNFTQSFLPARFKAKSQVVYPPVNISGFQAGKKSKLILSVGRFFCRPNNKKHRFLVTVFQELLPQMPGWQLVIAGSLLAADQKKFDRWNKTVAGQPIKLLPNLSFKQLRRLYSQAAIYWHAAGYGEGLDQYPEKAEHFGITTVEAMASGTVPVVINAGGQPEIVTHNQDGLLWRTKEELKNQTLQLIKLEKRWRQLSLAAQKRAQDFSKERFFQNLEKTLNGIDDRRSELT